MNNISVILSNGMKEELNTAIQKYNKNHCEENRQKLSLVAEKAYEEFMAAIMNAEDVDKQIQRLDVAPVDEITFSIQCEPASWKLWRQAFNLLTDNNSNTNDE